MSSPLAFTPLGPTFARTVTAASQALSPTLTTPPAAIAPLLGNVDYRFTVVGTQAVWIAYGTSAPTAAIPADGATGQGFMIEGPMSYTVSLPYGTFFAAIAAAGGSSIYVIIGQGVAL
jgi:hypothetical protein